MFPAASVQISQLESSLLAVNDAAALRSIPSAQQPRTAPYRMAYSCPSANVGCDHVDPTVSKLVTDSPPGLAIKVPIYLVTFATIDWRGASGDLLVALTCVRCS